MPHKTPKYVAIAYFGDCEHPFRPIVNTLKDQQLVMIDFYLRVRDPSTFLGLAHGFASKLEAMRIGQDEIESSQTGNRAGQS